jgi:hypothetical protein
MFQNQQFVLEDPEDKFFENLLSKAPQSNYNIEQKIGDQLDKDLQNRTAWFNRIKASIESLGLNSIYNANYQEVKNTSNTTYLECWRKLCDTYSSEIFQPSNLLSFEIKYQTFLNQNDQFKDQIKELESIGKVSAEALNLNLCTRWKEFIPELKKIISSCFLTGGAVAKIYFDPTLRRPTIRLIEPENFIIDPNCTSIETAEQVSHVFEIDQFQLEELQRNNIYLDINLTPNSDLEGGATDSVNRARDNISNIRRPAIDDNIKRFKICETIFMAFPKDVGDEFGHRISGGCKMPYKTHFQVGTNIALMRKRCWYPKAEEIRKKTDMIKFTYVQSMNFWGLGLIHLLENLHKNANNVQSNLDKAMNIVYSPTAIMGSSFPIEQSSIVVTPGELKQINTMNPSEMFHKFDFPVPTPIFTEYLANIENKMRAISSISQIKMESLPANIKGSVLLSLLMEDSKSMSAVMRQMITSLNEMYEIVKQFMINEMGDRFFINRDFKLKNKDIFKDIIDFKSTADPNYSNSAMQVILYQTIFEYAQPHPELFKMDELYRRFLEVLKITNIDEILFTKEELKQQAEQAQQAQQAQMQQEQAQAQAQMEMQAQQTSLIDKELEINKNKNLMDAEIKKLTLETNNELEALKMNKEEMKDDADIETQRLIEEERKRETILNYMLKVKELELKYGQSVDVQPEALMN